MDEVVDLPRRVRLEVGEERSGGLVVQQVQGSWGGEVRVQRRRGCTGEGEGKGGDGLRVEVVGHGSAEDTGCSCIYQRWDKVVQIRKCICCQSDPEAYL